MFSPRARALVLRLDPAAYVLWCAAWTLANARTFYGYMLKQTGGEWSAPLDDVFIHFDYARSTALGHPFEWVVGNGYSSGNTSLLYPFVLALGFRAGFRVLRLMVWAAIVAAASVLGVLLAARALFASRRRDRGGRVDGVGRAASYLLAPMLLGVGALDWSLWSGMEVAVFLGTWAIALYTFLALDRAPPASKERARLAWCLGAAGALMIVTRPEATTTLAVFGLASLGPLRKVRLRGAALQLVRIASPGVAVLAAQSLANRALTGEWSANGAIVKLAINSPYLTADEKLADYLFNLKYAVLRNVEYHFADAPAFGVILPALALAAVAVPQTRRVALVLWGQIAGWLVLVALNGQVRWQNERYVMPAVAWMLVAAALGATALVRKHGRPNVVVVAALGALAVQAVGVATRAPDTAPAFRFSWWLAIAGGVACAALLRVWPVRALAAVAALVVAHQHQAPKMRDQKWFFGRASRNIRDQHVTAGRWLARLQPHRVLVGDAGALLYASDRLGLDIIGLGGLGKLPFARAGVHGLPATLELMEYLTPEERPDVMAIYPTWWGVLPTWFSSGVLARFPVEGNVICGGYEKVVYRADWHLLGTGNEPRARPPREVVKDEVDVADLLSEKRHAYVFPHPAGGWTDMKILTDPNDTRLDMFDGGRRIAGGRAERFSLKNLDGSRAAHLVVRSAPDGRAHVRVRVAGREVGTLDFEPTDGWVERIVPLSPEQMSSAMPIEMANDGPDDFVDYHVWITQ